MSQSGPAKKVERIIDDNLKRVYDDALQEGVPDRFHDLLAALKEQERAQGKLE